MITENRLRKRDIEDNRTTHLKPTNGQGKGDISKGKTDEKSNGNRRFTKFLMTKSTEVYLFGNYGIETGRIFSDSRFPTSAGTERRITDALVWDKRIERRDNFEFDLSKKGAVSCPVLMYRPFRGLNRKAGELFNV